eukprot:2015419-Prymnesium_polylepis.2
MVGIIGRKPAHGTTCRASNTQARAQGKMRAHNTHAERRVLWVGVLVECRAQPTLGGGVRAHAWWTQHGGPQSARARRGAAQAHVLGVDLREVRVAPLDQRVDAVLDAPTRQDRLRGCARLRLPCPYSTTPSAAQCPHTSTHTFTGRGPHDT